MGETGDNGAPAVTAIVDLAGMPAGARVVVEGTVMEVREAGEKTVRALVHDGTGTAPASIPWSIVDLLLAAASTKDMNDLVTRPIRLAAALTFEESVPVMVVHEATLLHRDLANMAEAFLAELEETVDTEDTIAKPAPSYRDAAGIPRSESKEVGEYDCRQCAGRGTVVQRGPRKFVCLDCRRDQPDDVLVRRDPKKNVVDLHLSPRTTTFLKFRILGARNARQEADQAFKDLAIYPDARAFFDRAIDESMAALGDIRIRPHQAVVFNDDTIDIIIQMKTGDQQWPVIRKPFVVHKRVRVEDEIRIVATDEEDEEFAATFPEIIKRLDNKGQILDPKNVRPVVAHLVTHAPNHELGYPTYGVFERDGALVVPENFYPKRGPQRDAVRLLKPHLKATPEASWWKGYADFIRLFEPREIWPALCLAVLGAFTPVLRTRDVIVPGILHFSRNHGTGKTKSAMAASCKAWNLEKLSTDDLNSDFRFDAYFDRIAAPHVIDESQDFPFAKRSAQLKMALEGPRAGSRGTQDQELKTYRSYLSVIFTGQSLLALPEALLVRLLVVRFNEAREHLPEAVRKEFNRTFAALKVVGPELVRTAVASVDANLAKLIEHVEGTIQSQIEKRYTFFDHRRAQLWSYFYWAMQAWPAASKGLVAALTIDEFVETVIKPVETATVRAIRDPLEEFNVWFGRERADRSRGDHGVQGAEFLYAASHIDVEGARITGNLVNARLLKEFNKDMGDDNEAKIEDLPTLAEMVMRRYKLDRGFFFLKDDRVRVHRYGESSLGCVFIPDDPPDEVATLRARNLEKSNPPPPSTGRLHAAQGTPTVPDRIPRVHKLLVSLARGREFGLPRAELHDAAAAQGLSADDVTVALAHLLETGAAYSPRIDHFVPLD